MKKLLILGISGSIGTQTVDVIREHPEDFEIVGCSVYSNIEYLQAILKEFKIKYACIDKKDHLLEATYPDTKFYYGEEGLCQMTAELDYDILVNALVGISGLIPTLTAILNKHDVALANKETLVVAGDLVMKLASNNKVNIRPVDSEHSAIYQCLNGESKEYVKRLIITASGGAFRHLTHEELANVTLEEALHHPTWKMGKKVTVDSATMMNKGFEVIEAHHLFDIDYDHISVLQHSESIIHSMVEYNDRSVIAHLANPDMRIPIQYAISMPDRLSNDSLTSLNLEDIAELHFSKIDFKRYPLLELAYYVGKMGGNLGAALNAADEEAFNLFINEKIRFIDIEEIVIDAVKNAEYIAKPNLEELFKTDKKTRQYIKDKWNF